MPTPPSRPEPLATADLSAVVAFLAVGGRANRLAAEHIPDVDGRCQCCTAGPQRGRVRWPCVLATLAAHAQELARGDLSHPHGRVDIGPLRRVL